MPDKTYKTYGFWTLTFLVVANMIGAGVFTTSGFTLQALGSPHLVLVAWIVGGLIAIAGAVSYGQLVRLMPESGGEYMFLSRAAHPLLGFIAGWVSLIAGFSGAIAIAATTFETYILPDSLRPSWLPQDALAVAVIVVAAVFHGCRRSVGAVVQNIVVLLKLGLLTSLLLFAASRFSSETWHGEALAGHNLSTWQLVAAMAGSLVWISLSYMGFNAAVYVAEEANTPHVTVPRSLVAGTLVVILLYVLLNAVFVYAPPADSVAGRPDVAAVAAQWLGGGPDSIGGSRFALFVRLTISTALLTSVFSMMMAAPRVYAKMADDGMMPAFMRFQGDTPRMAIVLQVVLAGSLVLISTLRGLLTYLGLTLSLSAACSVACLFLPNVRRNPWWHASHLAPIFYILCTIIMAVLMTISNPRQILGTILTVTSGAAIYYTIGGALRNARTRVE